MDAVALAQSARLVVCHRVLRYRKAIGNVFKTMPEIVAKICGVTVESFFKKAILFKDAHCDDVSQKCLEAFASYGMKASQIAVRNFDGAFNYDLSFSLFNGNGTFKIAAEKMDISLQNATSDKDLEIVQDCIAKIYEHVPLPEISYTIFSATAHAIFPSIEAMQQYLLRFAIPAKQVVLGGTIAYVLCEKWAEEIRLTIDKSLAFPDGIFLAWTTTYRGNKLTRDIVTRIKDVFKESVTKFDLTFPIPQ